MPIANISAVIILLFFVAMMVAQFVGGAKLFESVTGYSYVIGLLIFGIVVISYTTVGGFRGVAITDAICGVMMIVGIVILAAGILIAGGGYENIMNTIMVENPGMMDPLSDGQMPIRAIRDAVVARGRAHVLSAAIRRALYGVQG